MEHIENLFEIDEDEDKKLYEFFKSVGLETSQSVLEAIASLPGVKTAMDAFSEWKNGYRAGEVVAQMRKNGLSDDDILDTCWGVSGVQWAREYIQ